MPLLILPLVIVLLFIVLIPVSIVARFRQGTAQRQARPWVVTLNLLGLILSAAMVLLGSLITSNWVPEAPAYTLGGLAAGGLAGMLGLLLTRWDVRGARLEYTPNRWLVLALTLLVTARIVYGIWRSMDALRTSLETMSVTAASGLSASMSAGAVVLGYYLVYWIGVRAKLRRLRG